MNMKPTLSALETVALAKALSSKAIDEARDALGDEPIHAPISIRVDLVGTVEVGGLTERNVFSSDRVRAAFLAEGIDPALVDRCFKAGTALTVCRGSARFLGELSVARRDEQSEESIDQSTAFIRRMRGA